MWYLFQEFKNKQSTVGKYLRNYEAQHKKIKFCRKLGSLPIQKKFLAFRNVPFRFYISYKKANLLTPYQLVLFSLSFLVIRTPVLFLWLSDPLLFWSSDLQYTWASSSGKIDLLSSRLLVLLSSFPQNSQSSLVSWSPLVKWASRLWIFCSLGLLGLQFLPSDLLQRSSGPPRVLSSMFCNLISPVL